MPTVRQDSPRVSVVIPVYNRVKLVKAAIESALAQDIDSLEVIAVDNCSNDGTWDLLQEVRDPRFRCLRNATNLGLFGNFNRCGELASGEYTVFLCSDDQLTPGFLREAVAQLAANSSAVLLSSRGRIIDSQGRPGALIANRFLAGTYNGQSVPAAWFWTNYHYGSNPLNYPSGVMFRTSALRSCLPFRAELGAPADIDMYLRVLRSGDLIVTESVGCLVMRHANQEGLKARAMGELTLQDLGLLEAFRRDLESAGAYRIVRLQAACLVLATLARTARVDIRKSFALFRIYSRGPIEMLIAIARRLSLLGLEKLFGWQFRPYLQPAVVRKSDDLLNSMQ